jgi:NAD(P)-dependent dehydrogenase (short-subunit alcohol dehydrogenase family)
MNRRAAGGPSLTGPDCILDHGQAIDGRERVKIARGLYRRALMHGAVSCTAGGREPATPDRGEDPAWPCIRPVVAASRWSPAAAGVRALARRFTRSAGGRIINLTSGQSLGPKPDELAYAATKGAIEAFTLSLSAELATLGITVNAVNPGPNDTGWTTNETREQVRERSPSGRIGTPADAARLVAFLASDAAAWITGLVIHSEGGFLRR